MLSKRKSYNYNKSKKNRVSRRRNKLKGGAIPLPLVYAAGLFLLMKGRRKTCCGDMSKLDTKQKKFLKELKKTKDDLDNEIKKNGTWSEWLGFGGTNMISVDSDTGILFKQLREKQKDVMNELLVLASEKTCNEKCQQWGTSLKNVLQYSYTERFQKERKNLTINAMIKLDKENRYPFLMH